VTDASNAAASLYRRFRPGRFADLRGQDHVVRALQGAVAKDRVVHAYLFSGPRGTGKTTTARILAKALNCENPNDGDACNLCASCVAITRGTSLDVVELDAASNNGVDDIREITVGAWHGSGGRWKVYIIDEVHMLSKGAEAAFLKTLEEPPAHVVFVLATTDPHRVVATIRSRTQHLEFRLLSAETLRALLVDVCEKAELDVDAATIAVAVRLGRGSARDALSALDQVVATGSLGDALPPFDDLLAAFVASDAVATLEALVELGRLGWDPEQLAEALAAELRQVFLLQVAPDAADSLDVERERLTQWGRQLGLPRTVRALEIVGTTLREMKGSPVPVVTLEVALVRLTHPDLDDSVAALEERVSRLERSSATTHAPAPPPVAPRPIPSVARTARATAPEQTVSPTATPAAAPTATPTSTTPSTPTEMPSLESRLSDVPTPDSAPVQPSASARSSDDELSSEDFARRFSAAVLPRLARSAQQFLAQSTVKSVRGSVVTLTVPNESLRSNADRFQSGLRSALEHEFHTPFQIQWVIDDSVPVPAPVATTIFESPIGDDLDDEDVEGSEPLAADSVATLLITEAFPGAEEIT
jgi:DNA polymerase III subunit gamma/tau